MSTQRRAFRPLAATQNTAVGTAPTTVTLNNTLGVRAIRFVNVGNQTVFIQFSQDAAPSGASVSVDLPLPAGQTEVFTVGTDIITYSVIAAATGSTVYSTIGEGM